MMRSAPRVAAIAALLLAALAMTLQLGSVPHLHRGEVGLFNAEHDLTLLAGVAGHGLPAEAAPAMTSDSVSTALPLSTPVRPAVWLGHTADSRAPPLS